MREKERMLYACLGDSITSEQVTGIGTMVCRKLGMELLGNFAFGWATGSDWHDGEETLTPCCLEDLPNEFSPKNVLSNQVRRLLKAAEDKGRSPRVIYIAISTNDGARDWREESPVPLEDDTEQVCRKEYEGAWGARCAGQWRPCSADAPGRRFSWHLPCRPAPPRATRLPWAGKRS